MVERYITPQKLMTGRFKDETHVPQWDIAILCFRGPIGSRALVETLSGVPVGRPVFWGTEKTTELSEDAHLALAEEPAVFTADVDGQTVGIATRCVWGGPQAAILIEELSAMGVKSVIGYGAAGSIDPSLSQGEQLVVRSAPATDGTSRQYGSGPFTPDQSLLAFVPEAHPVTAATVDAVYRETPDLVKEWQGIGAQVVNMESASFYAAASACGVRAIWIGHVSDLLVGDWHDWYVDRRDMNDSTIENCLAIIRGMSKQDDSRGCTGRIFHGLSSHQ